MSKPTNLAEWATGGGAPIAEPLLAEKQAGWAVESRPPAQWFNWWMKTVYTWIVWLDAFESTAHSWSALQTFTAGILASSFGSSPGTPGIRGTNAIDGTSDIDGSGLAAAIKGSTSTNSSTGIFGEATHSGAYGGSFKNVTANAAATGAQALGAGTGFRGRASYYAGVHGIIDDSLGTPQTNAGGVVGNSYVDGLPGVRGEGVFADAIGGFFLGYNPVDESASGGSLALQARGGDSPTVFYDAGGGFSEDYDAGHGMIIEAGDGLGDGTANTNYDAGSNFVYGGDVYGAQNDAGLPGIGLQIFGGEVIGTGTSNGRPGGTALYLEGGASESGQGASLVAHGDAYFFDRIKLSSANLPSTTAQTNQITPGLVVKAWAKVRLEPSKTIDVRGGQNIAGAGVGSGPGGRPMFYVDLASAVPKNTRFVLALPEDKASSSTTMYAAPAQSTYSQVTNTRIWIHAFESDGAGTTTEFDPTAPAYLMDFNVLVMGLQ